MRIVGWAKRQRAHQSRVTSLTGGGHGACAPLPTLQQPPQCESYFLTQITRTAAALASVELPNVVTSLAFRKSRTASPVTSTAWVAGAVLADAVVATTTGFNSASPANL